jgi:CDP-glycerol glycerophosphotransferase
MSHRGSQYSCNPKYIYEYIVKKNGKNFECIWVLNNDVCNLQVPVIKYNSLKYYYYILTAKVIISNLPFHSSVPLRKGQKCINTWHGGGAYKSVDGLGDTINKYYYKRIDIISKQTTLYLSSCKKFTEVTSLWTRIPTSKFLESGMPRNDLFFIMQQNIDSFIRQTYNVLPGQSILLYAPTYRGNPKYAEFINELDIDKCIQALNQKFNTNTIVFFRSHHTFNITMDSENVIDVSEYPDMQELLYSADFLMTDYSSCMWDFALTRKPGFLFVPDIDLYEKERSFYTPIELWPYPAAKTNEDLYQIICDYTQEEAELKIKNHLKLLGSFENGNATEMIGNIIEEWCL